MGCIYTDNDGVCTIDHDDEMMEDGYCCFDDDPDPSDSCESYESDNMCRDCYADLNVEDCTCED